MREIIGHNLPQSTLDRIIDESDIIGDHKIWKDEFLALGAESNAANNTHHFAPVYLTRSKSADDFDSVQAQSFESKTSDLSFLGTDQFSIEKAKSVRKASRQLI